MESTASHSQIVDLLEATPLFADLSRAEIVHVASVCRLVEGPAGERLLWEGEPVHKLYVLQCGDASVLKADDAGQQVVISSVGKGAVVGEMSLLDNSSASATVVTQTPFRALELDRAAFLQVMETYPALGFKVWRKFARITSLRLRMASGLLTEYMAPPCQDLGLSAQVTDSPVLGATATRSPLS
ncbi:MAG: cyclic nucleotide-binding domain-containing protein [Nitrospirae bacterium]|nr:MAG: cyclic nucleotide-binding domain-containing protein [Nitrospirota bacterium]